MHLAGALAGPAYAPTVVSWRRLGCGGLCQPSTSIIAQGCILVFGTALGVAAPGAGFNDVHMNASWGPAEQALAATVCALAHPNPRGVGLAAGRPDQQVLRHRAAPNARLNCVLGF